MTSLLTIPLLLLPLGALPDRSSEEDLARVVEGSREWLVAVFPSYRLPGEEEADREPSLRERMWKRWDPEGEGSAMGQKYLGSGIVVSEQGEILTSDKVIEPGAESVGIRFCDGRTLKAAVVARYERGNLALVKAEGGPYPAAPLSDRDLRRPGDIVFTVGNVLDSIGIDGTVAVSRGVVSRIGMAAPGSRYRGWVIETDAAVNVGSPGGALLDIDGKIIGVVDTGYSRHRWLGQAIPIDVAREVLPDLKRGWLPRHTIGIRMEALPDGGVGIVSVEEGGPGGKAGLHPGDRIREAEGETIERPRQVDGIVARLPIGTPIRIRILRGADEMDLRVRISREAVVR